jgi:hypothetical protein
MILIHYTFFDINQQQLEPWNNTAFSVIALIQPISNSRFTNKLCYRVGSCYCESLPTILIYPHNLYKTGGVFMLSSLDHHLGHHFFYDVISDVWTKTALGGNFTECIGNRFCDRSYHRRIRILSGTASGTSSRT